MNRKHKKIRKFEWDGDYVRRIRTSLGYVPIRLSCEESNELFVRTYADSTVQLGRKWPAERKEIADIVNKFFMKLSFFDESVGRNVEGDLVLLGINATFNTEDSLPYIEYFVDLVRDKKKLLGENQFLNILPGCNSTEDVELFCL